MNCGSVRKAMLSWVPALWFILPCAALADTDAVPTQGAMMVKPPDGGKDAPAVDLPLKHTKVDAEISGYISRVKVTQTFSNPYEKPIEAIYVFPLPQDAAVSDMQIRIGDRLIKGEIKKREEARKIYEEAKAAGKTAALLEQERPNIFSQSVANIMPGNDILVEITYDDILKYEKGGYEFAFPMVVGPRFIPGAPAGKQGGGWAPDTDQVPDASRITPPVLKPGERNGHDIEVNVKLNAGVPVQSLRSPSHEIVVTPAPGQNEPITGTCEIKLAAHDTIPNKDFVLRYDVAGTRPEMGLLSHRGDLGGYFMLLFQPPENPQPAEVTPKEMVFVMDCSGSMSGEPIALSKKAVRNALGNLNSNDTFQIIRFSESASPFAKEPLLNTPENVRRGLSYINGLEGEGGTMMIEGIKAALDYPHRENRLRIVCFMTDGYIGNEAEILDAIQKRIGEDTRLFSFGVGSSVNRYLLERMAEVGRGEVQYVLLNEKPDEAVARFYERVRNPVLTHIRVNWGGLEVSGITPARVRDLFTGQPMFVLGRYDKAGQETIKIQAKSGGRDVTYEIPVALPELQAENTAIASLWARARIKELEAEQYGGQNPDVVNAVTDLALKYRLMSQYTSFVAVEEKVVNSNGVLTTVQVPVEMPEGVSYEGVFGNDAYDMSGSPKKAMMLTRNRAGGHGFLGGALYAPACSAPASQEAKSLSEVVCDSPAPEKETPARLYAIELSLADGQTILITSDGEVWKSTAGASPSRVMTQRLSRESQRLLAGDISMALTGTEQAIAFAQAGTLTIQVLDEKGQVEKTVTIKLDPKDGTTSEAWNKVLDAVLKTAE